tara:strand:- start:1148 stop:3091 length:1944 start_codon:yes stop_codon:yes gene_type:complete
MAKNPKNLFGIMDLFKSKPKIDPVTNKPPAKQGVQFGPTKKEATDTLFDQGIKQQQELRNYTMFDEASDTLNQLETSLKNMKAGQAVQPFTIARKTMDMLRESALTRYIQNTDFKKYGYEGYLPRGEYRDRFANQLKIAFKDIAPNENVDDFLELVRKWQTNTIGSAELAKKFPILMEKGGAQGLGFRSVGEALQEDLFMGELSLIGTLKGMGATESKNITSGVKVVTPDQKVIKQASNVDKFIDEAVQGTEFTPNQIKEAIVKNYNDAYEAGSPKRISIDDDEAIERLVDINTNYGKTDRQNYIQDIIEDAYEIQINKGKKANPADEVKRLEGLEALEKLDTKNRKPNAYGGRIGFSLGGVGKGIMEAIKLASRGIKPFGQKQTYNQNVKTMGLSNFDQVEVITSKQIDELRNANDVDGLFEMLEDIVSGKKFGMANSAQRKILQENIEEALNDIPLNKDSRERLSEDYFNMMEYYKPDPEETGKVIPFKPKDEKATGGRVGANKGLFASQKLIEFMKKAGMKSPDKIADKKQIENVIRDPDTELERTYKDNPVTGQKATPADRMTIDEIRDMIQNDPRYDGLTRKQMDLVVKRETTRADFAYNMGMKPEEVPDDVVDMLMREGYANRFGMANGGGVGTLFRRRKV